MTMKQKTYRGYRDGYRTSDPLIVFVHNSEGEGHPLAGVSPPGTWDRGPGFEWGYDGGGPKKLALAILNDYLGREPHDWIIDRFVRQIIAKLDVAKPRVISGQEIDRWLKLRRRAKSFMLYADAN